MLNELVETGYTGTELGDWGYMPTDPSCSQSGFEKRKLVMLGAFVPVAMKYPEAHAEGVAIAVKTARLLAAVAGTPAPYLVLADDNGTDPVRTQIAGRVTPADGLTPSEWKTFAAGADQIAKAVFEETGLRTVFHHHCAGYVETPDEIATLLELTNPARLGLVFDTGHYYYGTGQETCDLVAALNRFKDRIWYIHLKDLDPQIAAPFSCRAMGLLHRAASRRFLRTRQRVRRFSRAAPMARRAELPGLCARRAGCTARHGHSQRKRATQPRIHSFHRIQFFPNLCSCFPSGPALSCIRHRAGYKNRSTPFSLRFFVRGHSDETNFISES